LTPWLLDFSPAAWQAYQGLPPGELRIRVRQALEQLAADPAAVRADPRSRRHPIIEERLQQAAQVWGLPVDAPVGSRWLVVWREAVNVIEIGYIGPAPQQGQDDQG
jgi:hypothetical protein